MAVYFDMRDALRAIVRAPMLRAGAPFTIGLALAMACRPSWPWVTTGWLVLTVITVVRLWSPLTSVDRWQRGLLLACWFLWTGMFRQVLDDPGQGRYPIPGSSLESDIWAVRITAVNGTSAHVHRADGSLEARAVGPDMVPVRGDVMLTLLPARDGHFPVVGDRLLVRGAMEPITRVPDPGGFDRRAWAAARGISHEIFAPAGAWTILDHRGHWTDMFTRGRRSIERWLEGSALARPERALVKALVLGQRDELDSEQRSAFARSGTIHVLAVSGMHVGLIFGALTFLFSWLGKGHRARIVRGMFILAALWAYAGLTGASPSVLRATVMFSVFTIAEMRQQRSDNLNNLFVAAFILLLWDPTMLSQAGFQLSFLAVLGIILFYRPLERLWSPRHRSWRGVWSLLVVSFAAQLLTTPVSLYLFKAFPVWFLPANLVVVTAVGLAVNGAIALLLLYKVPLVGVAITWSMTLLLQGIGKVTAFFAALPGAYPDVRIGAADMVLMYVLVLAIAAWWQWRWRIMRWVTLVSVGLLLTGWALRAHHSVQRNVFTVYDDRGSLSAAMLHGRQLSVLFTSDSLAGGDRSKQRVDRHRKAVGAGVPVMAGPDQLNGTDLVATGSALLAGGRWLSHAFDVHFIDGRSASSRVGPDQPHDVIVFHAISKLDTVQADALISKARHVVLAARVGWNARELIREQCDMRGIALHDVREQGAFILER